MAGEVSTAGIAIKYAPEATAGTRPTTGYKAKATGATLNIADYVTGINGLGAEYEQYEVTSLSETQRHRFIPGLMGNDGNVSLNANINKTSRTDWGLIVSEYEELADSGKALWFEFTLPNDDQSLFIRAIPCPMNFPDVEVAQAVQGAIQLIENQYAGWADKST